MVKARVTHYPNFFIYIVCSLYITPFFLSRPREVTCPPPPALNRVSRVHNSAGAVPDRWPGPLPATVNTQTGKVRRGCPRRRVHVPATLETRRRFAPTLMSFRQAKGAKLPRSEIKHSALCFFLNVVDIFPPVSTGSSEDLWD